MTSSVSLKFTGLLAVVLTGAVLGYKRPDLECIPVDSCTVVREGGPATVRFLLRNMTNRTVKLRARSPQCEARLEGVPEFLPPGESREIRLVFETVGRNGPHRFAAAISTDANPKLIPVASDVEIHADWVVRHVAMGKLPEQKLEVRRVRIDNVPAGNLVRVSEPAQSGWSARLVATGERFVEVEMTGTPARLEADEPERRVCCDFSLYFADADVRRVQVVASAIVTIDAPQADRNLSSTSGGELYPTIQPEQRR